MTRWWLIDQATVSHPFKSTRVTTVIWTHCVGTSLSDHVYAEVFILIILTRTLKSGWIKLDKFWWRTSQRILSRFIVTLIYREEILSTAIVIKESRMINHIMNSVVGSIIGDAPIAMW